MRFAKFCLGVSTCAVLNVASFSRGRLVFHRAKMTGKKYKCCATLLEVHVKRKWLSSSVHKNSNLAKPSYLSLFNIRCKILLARSTLFVVQYGDQPADIKLLKSVLMKCYFHCQCILVQVQPILLHTLLKSDNFKE